MKNKVISLRNNNYYVADKVRGETIITTQKIIILIHGYNVSEQGVKAAYKRFENNFNLSSNNISGV